MDHHPATATPATELIPPRPGGGWALSRRFRRRNAGLVALSLCVAVVAALGFRALVPSGAAPAGSRHELARSRSGPGGHSGARTGIAACPWLARAVARSEPPATLASLAVSRMTLAEKLGFIGLRYAGRYENVNQPVARLCIPALTLQDGPAGLAAGMQGVTQLPAPLGLASSFDTALARQYGQVQGDEARGKGVDVVQGPNLNLDRLPQDGRAFEGYGEDPYLASQLGVADIAGIQSRSVIAQAKHLVAYNQETGRVTLDASVPTRALHELYLAPFEAAVTQGHVGSLMCAYPKLDGTYQCQDAALYSTVDRWGFTGFVRSDLGAVHDPVAALEAGVDLIKPAATGALATAVATGALPVAVVTGAVTQVLTSMFAFGLVQHPRPETPLAPIDTPAHTAFARTAAEDSAVLLQDRGGVLPLATRGASLAVIGANAGAFPMTAGRGSSYVTPPAVPTALSSIVATAGPQARVAYVPEPNAVAPLPPPTPGELQPPGRRATGADLSLSVTNAAGATVYRGAASDVNTSVCVGAAQPATSGTAPAPPNPAPTAPGAGGTTGGGRPPHTRPDFHSGGGSADTARPTIPRLTCPAYPGLQGRAGTRVALPRSSGATSATLTGTLTPPASGLYMLSLSCTGGAVLTLDGHDAVASPGTHGPITWSGAVPLVGGHHYALRISWDIFPMEPGLPSYAARTGMLRLGLEDVSGPIAQAVAAARHASVAVVFANDVSSEGFDRPSLSLPGMQDALIAAVAAANPRTVVVLSTGGPVLMPWHAAVAAILETWYAGEQFGPATAAILFGAVDPAGHLPVTFPASAGQEAVTAAAQFPGVDGVSTYSEGLDIGYRFDQAHGLTPLFPFGFGLSYTTFSLSRLHITRAGSGERVTVTVTDTGRRAGAAVPQTYVGFPPGSGEPPYQLAAFARITLDPGASSTVSMMVGSRSFQVYRNNRWQTPGGQFRIAVGQSSADLALAATVPAP
ncbi:MAG: glycoside hydrolase family 3 C-terminal domain-containing protein [Actinomycetota bacterium]|nr:glycoside hydrolase family 3 C-terminal domain-containing protein [Actinomycetota bacterium]